MKTRLAFLPLLLLAALFTACKSQDPRLAVFEKFNRATTYEEARPLLSGIVAGQLDAVHASKPEQVPKLLNSLHLVSYTPRIVNADANTSFLVLDNVKSDTVKQSTQTYLLARTDGDHWTIANRVMAENVQRSLWTNQYSPAQFNQPTQCSVSGTDASMQSAIAVRSKDRIEVRLLPFPLSAADLEYIKLADGGIATSSPAYQQSQIRLKHAECRIIFALDPSGRIHSINLGSDDPATGASTLFQGPNWSALPPSGAQTNPQNGLPPEFKNLVISDTSIKLESLGNLSSGPQSIRWNTKLDIPLLQKGL